MTASYDPLLRRIHWATAVLFIAAMLIGLGSSIFHPESSRVARTASGGRFGTAQSLFQLGGNGGQALGPLLAAFLVVPFGRPVLGWLALIALGGVAVLWRVGAWAEGRRGMGRRTARSTASGSSARPTTREALTWRGISVRWAARARVRRRASSSSVSSSQARVSGVLSPGASPARAAASAAGPPA